MAGLFTLVFAAFGVMFSVLFILTWRRKDISVSRKGGISLLLVLGLIALSYTTFAFFLISSDHAYYSTNGMNLGEVDYDSIIENATDSGYDVEGPYFVNSDMDDAHGLYSPDAGFIEEHLGDEYWVVFIESYYTNNSFFEARLGGAGDGTVITFFNQSNSGMGPAPIDEVSVSEEMPIGMSVGVDDLPDDEWIIQQLELMFDIDQQRAEEYIVQLENSIEGKQNKAEITVDEDVEFEKLYEHFDQKSTIKDTMLTSGDGWYEEMFYDGNRKLGCITYIVPNVRIVHKQGDALYSIQLDKLGGVDPQVRLERGKRISEDECRDVFRDMFEDIGLSGEAVDAFYFDYTSSVW